MMWAPCYVQMIKRNEGENALLSCESYNWIDTHSTEQIIIIGGWNEKVVDSVQKIVKNF